MIATKNFFVIVENVSAVFLLVTVGGISIDFNSLSLFFSLFKMFRIVWTDLMNRHIDLVTLVSEEKSISNSFESNI